MKPHDYVCEVQEGLKKRKPQNALENPDYPRDSGRMSIAVALANSGRYYEAVAIAEEVAERYHLVIG